MAYQGPSRPLRPIAPRATSLPGSPAPPPAEEGKIKRASNACKECQRRRTKCSEGRPYCTECEVHGRECIYNEAGDKRRKLAAKQTQKELEYYRGFLEQLLETIRLGDHSHVQHVIDVIRAGATHEEIRSVLKGLTSGDLENTRMNEDELDGIGTPDGWT